MKRISTSRSYTIRQIEFWDNRVYPIYSRAKAAFRDWVDHAVSRTRTNKVKSFPLSDITFSILDRKGGVNASRFAIGVFNPKIEDYELFNSVAAYLTRKKLFVEPDSSIALLGIGEDIKAGEDKFYIYIKNPWNKKITIMAYTFKDGRLVEKKVYKPIKKGYEGKGSRGTRKQVNYELEGAKAMKVINKLPVSERTKNLSKKILESDLFSLDTISYSKERGIAIYFD